jgi:hypothetical protein
MMRTAIAWGLLLLFPAAGTGGEPGQRYLVLQNESTLRGRIERTGDGYSLTTGAGESVIPARQVLAVCDSAEEAYRLLASRANLRDPQERVRLARWCWANGLPDLARAELAAAREIDPGHVEARRLTDLYRQPPAERHGGPPQHNPAGPAGVKAQAVPGAARVTPDPSYSSETLQGFTVRVQPILFNSCATAACHGGNKGGAYHVQRPAHTGQPSAPLTRNNLLQTLLQIDKEDPAGSPVLIKAVEPHGGATRPPVGGKDAPAYKALEAWVFQVAPPPKKPETPPDPNGEAGDAKAGAEVAPTKGDGGNPETERAAPPDGCLPDTAATEKPLQPSRPSPAGSAKARTPTAFASERGEGSKAQALPPGSVYSSAAKETRPTPVDPFDPMVFNRKFHPDRAAGREVKKSPPASEPEQSPSRSTLP